MNKYNVSKIKKQSIFNIMAKVNNMKTDDYINYKMAKDLLLDKKKKAYM